MCYNDYNRIIVFIKSSGKPGLFCFCYGSMWVSTSRVLPGVGGGGVARDFAKKFYNSKQWIKCREAYKQSVNGLCERCLSKGKYVPGDEVHHKIYLTPENINDPNITLSFENLELLCSSCHNNEHHSTDVTAEGLCFNEHGELVVDNPKKSANNI